MHPLFLYTHLLHDMIFKSSWFQDTIFSIFTKEATVIGAFCPILQHSFLSTS